MLGGNPDYMARSDLKKAGYTEEIIAEATGYADTDNEEILAARQLYADKQAEYKTATADEAEQVKQAGGLFILGTERHESRRIDNQLRGRSGRQGDPGESRFFIAMLSSGGAAFFSRTDDPDIQGYINAYLAAPDDTRQKACDDLCEYIVNTATIIPICFEKHQIITHRGALSNMGVDQITVQNLDVVSVDPELNMLVVRGAIPGPKGGIVYVKTTVKTQPVKKGAAAAISANPQKASARVNPQKASARNK